MSTQTIADIESEASCWNRIEQYCHGTNGMVSTKNYNCDTAFIQHSVIEVPAIMVGAEHVQCLGLRLF